jgi:hypothetical protein
VVGAVEVSDTGWLSTLRTLAGCAASDEASEMLSGWLEASWASGLRLSSISAAGETVFKRPEASITGACMVSGETGSIWSLNRRLLRRVSG